jgi:AraC-like DNA-binding protein
MDKTEEQYRYPRFPEISLHLTCGAKSSFNEQWASKSKLQIDEYNRLYCVLEGDAFIQGSRGRVDLVPGYIYLIPSQYKFHYNCPESILLLWVHFQLEFLPGLDVFQRYEPKVLYAASEFDIESFKQLVAHLEAPSPEVFLELRVLLLRLIKPFMPRDWKTIQPNPENEERLKPALELLNKYYNRPFNLSSTAKSVNMSPASMSDLFRRTFGIAPSRYLMNLRIRRAQNLLLTTDRRISDIGAECGFEDPLYFSRIFSKRCCSSPREFRKNRGI